MSDDIPLCVDMDGTLIRTDSMIESIVLLLKQNLIFIFLLPAWLLQGKAKFKGNIAMRVVPEPEILPYNEELIQYIAEEKEKGRKIYLVTAANYQIAERVSRYLDLFDGVIASDDKSNIKGVKKRERIVSEIGGRFDYAGNESADLDIWSHAHVAILVNPGHGVEAALRRIKQEVVVLDRHACTWISLLRAIRIHQWLKNGLVFVPLLVSHGWESLPSIVEATLAFMVFSFFASAGYLINDILDMASDRRHPVKCKRPIVSGEVSVKLAAGLVVMLFVLAIAVGSMLPELFMVSAMIYMGVSLLYSMLLKRIVLFDVVILAGLYTMRIIGGSAAIGVEPSFWLLAFSMFLFFSLALVKRFSELMDLRERGRVNTEGRGYNVADLETLNSFGAASGFLSVLVLALYINSEDVMELYSHPKAIWLLCPLLLYWIGRVWVMARRGNLHVDPVVYAVTDRPSLMVILLMAAILLLAI